MTGTWINILLIVVGSLAGLFFGARLTDRFRVIVFQGIGVFTLFLGISMALKSGNPLILVLSMVVGGLLGEWWKLNERIENVGERLKSLLRSRNEKFSEGLLTAFLLYCMGSLTILGAIEEGLGQGSELLITKSIMDGFSSVILAAGLGIGVLFSVIPLLLYQGGITLMAASIQPYLSEMMMDEMTAVGGLILVALSISILEIKKIKVINFVPALLVALAFAWLYGKFFV